MFLLNDFKSIYLSTYICYPTVLTGISHSHLSQWRPTIRHGAAGYRISRADYPKIAAFLNFNLIIYLDKFNKKVYIATGKIYFKEYACDVCKLRVRLLYHM